MQKRSKMRNYISHQIYKTIGTLNFVRQIEWQSILEWLDPRGGDKILDVACGWGELSPKIAERGCAVYGIDMSEDGIKSARHLAEREGVACEFVVGSAEDLPYTDGYFDKIVCSSSLEHFRNDINALKEMCRVLKQDGRVILTTDSFTYPISDEVKEEHMKIANVVNYYTRETLKERFEIAGFEMHRSEHLLNSRLTSFFFKIGIKTRWSGKLWMVVFFIAYPLCLISDKLFGVKDIGYTLIVEGRKLIINT